MVGRGREGSGHGTAVGGRAGRVENDFVEVSNGKGCLTYDVEPS